MDFISKNYEKLILAFCLLLLLVGIGGVAMSASSTTKLLSENHQKAKRDVAGGELVAVMNTSAYNVERYFNDPRKVCAILGNSSEQTSKGSMLEGNKMIMCVNEDCRHILLLKEDVCPFCNTKQPELAKNTGAEEDTDGDGVPDLVEQKYDFMNYRDPKDAMMDQDGDCFLNAEEIKLNTDPDNADDFPPLAYLLRVVRVWHQVIPVEMVEIEKNRSEEVSKWDITLKFRKNRSEAEPRRHTVQLNEVIMGKYKVVQAGFNNEGEMATPYVVLVSEGVSGEVYRLEPGRRVEQAKPTVQLIYLVSRKRSEFNAMRRDARAKRMLIKNVTQNDTFQYSARKEEENYTEYYRLLEADAKAKSCKVALLDGKGGAVIKTIDVPAFDEKSETIFMKEERGENGMMNDVDMDMPDGMRGGPMPGRRSGPGAGARPSRR